MCPLIPCFAIVSHYLSDDRHQTVDPQISLKSSKIGISFSKFMSSGTKLLLRYCASELIIQQFCPWVPLDLRAERRLNLLIAKMPHSLQRRTTAEEHLLPPPQCRQITRSPLACLIGPYLLWVLFLYVHHSLALDLGLLFWIHVSQDFLLFFKYFLCILFGQSPLAYDLVCFGFNVFGHNFNFSKDYFFLLANCLIPALQLSLPPLSLSQVILDWCYTFGLSLQNIFQWSAPLRT